jgi:transposase
MFVDRIKNQLKDGTIRTQYLLRTSHRDGKKVTKKTVLNITSWGSDVCEAIALVLKNKHNLSPVIRPLQNTDIPPNSTNPSPPVTDSPNIFATNNRPVLTLDKSIGAVWLLYCLAQQIGLVDALGHSRESNLALWQIIARTIDQGSRLSATRLAKTHEIDFLELQRFSEDSLYKNLDWLAEHQSEIQKKLFNKRYETSGCSLFLYDVTSSYFEGVQNELAAYGYNRDKKHGKMQIVAGLLCAKDGTPVAVEVFEGNTNDTKTMHNQIKTTSEQFHAKNVVFVGDRGMIKSAQQKELEAIDFDFITALTRVQIEKLIKQDVFSISLFDEKLSEVILDNGKRYILKRNPVRATEISDNRKSKLSRLKEIVNNRNDYLSHHSRAKTETPLKYCNNKLRRLNLDGWVCLKLSDSQREVAIVEDKEKLQLLSKLDGCYCLTTSLTAEELDMENVHSRYKDLAKVEQAFRTCKTGQLEMRPIYVRKKERTRGHVFVVMLSYLLIQKLRECWGGLDMTVEEGIERLKTLCTLRMQTDNNITVQIIPKPSEDIEQLFTLANIPPPEVLPTHPATRPNTKSKLNKKVSNKKNTKK